MTKRFARTKQSNVATKRKQYSMLCVCVRNARWAISILFIELYTSLINATNYCLCDNFLCLFFSSLYRSFNRCPRAHNWHIRFCADSFLSDVNNIRRHYERTNECTYFMNKQQELMNQATCIVLTHQQRSLAPGGKRIFDDMMIIDSKLSRKLI